MASELVTSKEDPTLFKFIVSGKRIKKLFSRDICVNAQYTSLLYISSFVHKYPRATCN